jgi:DNA-binding NarL/FixJ family response regulator
MVDPHLITILTADDHPLIRAGLEAVIGREPDMQLVGEAANGEQAVAQYRTLRPDVVLMDLIMPLKDGLTAIKEIVTEFPDARIIALTSYDGDEDIHRALAAGAKGYLLKEMLRTEVLGAIRSVYRGHRAIPAEIAATLAEYTPRAELTPRELEVLRLVAKGFSNAEIGALIGRTEGTVKVHLKNILEKLGVGDRTEAVTTAIQRGYIRLD